MASDDLEEVKELAQEMEALMNGKPTATVIMALGYFIGEAWPGEPALVQQMCNDICKFAQAVIADKEH